MEWSDTQHVDFGTTIILPLFKGFLKSITNKQWVLLTSGHPDTATKILLGEVILTLISSLTKSFLMVVTSRDTNGDSELSQLKDLITESFCKALRIQDEADMSSVESLSQLIEQEVTENVNSRSKTPVENIIPSNRVDYMVDCTCIIFKKFAAKVKSIFRPRRQKHGQEIAEVWQPENDDGMQEDRDPPEDKDPSRDNVKLTNSDIVKRAIGKEVNDIIPPLLDGIPHSDFEKLRMETSHELSQVGDQVTSLICDKGKKQGPLKEGMKKIQDFFTTCFANAWIFRLQEQLSRKHKKDTSMARSHSAESLLNAAVFGLKNGAENQGDHDQSLFSLLKNLSDGKALIFTKALSDLIYSNMVIPEIVPKSVQKQWRSPYVPATHAEMYDDIKCKIWIFTVLMNWWVKKLVQTVNSRVELAILEREADLMAQQVCEEMKEREAMETLKKNHVKFFIEKIVLHIYYKLRIMPQNSDDVINRLFENVWAEVQGANFYFTSKTLKKNLNKKINKVLHQKLGSPELMLYLLNCKDPVIEECIITILQQEVMTPPQNSNRRSICAKVLQYLRLLRY